MDAHILRHYNLRTAEVDTKKGHQGLNLYMNLFDSIEVQGKYTGNDQGPELIQNCWHFQHMQLSFHIYLHSSVLCRDNTSYGVELLLDNIMIY